MALSLVGFVEFGAALLDAAEALKMDKTFVKAYYRRATANFALCHFKEALVDYEAVAKVRTLC